MSVRPSASPSAVSKPSYVTPVVAVVLLLLVAALANGQSTASGGEQYDLTPADTTTATHRVSVELEFGGDLLANELLATDKQSQKVEPKRAPLKVEATVEYDERGLTAEKSVRLYRKAEATIQSGAGRRLPALPTGRRLVVATRASTEGKTGRAVLTSPNGSLTREQLDLIDIAGDARLLDRLLPSESHTKGGEWTLDADTMGALLGLDSVAVCEVRCLLDDGNKKYARFQVAGAVHGAVDGAATEFDVRAIGLFRRDRRQVTQLNLAMTEKREVGPARPGVEGTAKLKIKRLAADTPQELSDEKLAALEPDASALMLHAARQGFRALHDRRWHVAAESRTSLAMRCVEASGLIAQTTVRVLPPKSEGRRPTLEAFEAEIKQSLGGSLVQLVSSEQWTNQAGCYCMGLAAEGKTDGVPVVWRYYLVMPGEKTSGDARQMISLVSTIEPAMARRVGKADRELADRMELVAPVQGAPGIAALEPVTPKRVAKRKVSRPKKKVRVATEKPHRRGGIRRR